MEAFVISPSEDQAIRELSVLWRFPTVAEAAMAQARLSGSKIFKLVLVEVPNSAHPPQPEADRPADHPQSPR